MYFSELLSLPNFRILPRTFTHLSAYVHVYCRVCIIRIYMAETPRVLHFSAFIVTSADTSYSYTIGASLVSDIHEWLVYDRARGQSHVN